MVEDDRTKLRVLFKGNLQWSLSVFELAGFDQLHCQRHSQQRKVGKPIAAPPTASSPSAGLARSHLLVQRNAAVAQISNADKAKAVGFYIV